MVSNEMHVAIIGGGVIGLSAALTAAQHGHRITVLDPIIEDHARGNGASWMAGGMLAPVTEAWFGEEARLALDIAALKAWPAFARNISAIAERELAINMTGTLQIALDIDDARELERVRNFQNSVGLAAHALSRDELLDLEPLLSPNIVGGSLISTDLSVDNRSSVLTLKSACEKVGVHFVAARVTEVLRKGNRVHQVVAGDERLDIDELVIAAGAWSSDLVNMLQLPNPGSIPTIRPIRGEILRLRSDITAINHTLRAHVHGFQVYLVPRAHGEIVVGATQFERGFDARPTAGGVYELLRDSRELLPYINEMELLEVGVGLRPGSPDNAPIIDRIPGVENAILATGHYRNGILLTSIAGEVVAALLAHSELPADAEFVSLARFSEVVQ